MLKEVRHLLPHADLLYVADQARAPYGVRDLDSVLEISLEIADWLVSAGADTLVVACNTASAAALEEIRARHSAVPVVGMEPAVKPAAAMSEANVVGVFATGATFQGRLFDSVVARHAKGTRIATMACPEWVDLVENGHISGRRAAKLVSSAVDPVVAKGADVLVLGCTHFSFLRELIEQASGLPVIDPARPVAERVQSVAASAGGSGSIRLLTSGDVDKFRRIVGELTQLSADFGRYPE